MQKLQILFPNPVMARLRAVAEAEDRPVSELIRRAVERFLDLKPPTRVQKPLIPTFKGGQILVSAEDLKKAIYESESL